MRLVEGPAPQPTGLAQSPHPRRQNPFLGGAFLDIKRYHASEQGKLEPKLYWAGNKIRGNKTR